MRGSTGFTTLIVVFAGLRMASAAFAQDVSPLAPIPGRTDPAGDPAIERPADTRGVVIPLPQAANRAEAAEAARVHVATALPATWTAVATRYQPFWAEVEPLGAFGIGSWSPWFAAAGFVPVLSPHPFFSPWGLLAYDGWMYDRYRALWGPARPVDDRPEAATWLQRGDREMLAGRPREAAQAYRRVTQIASDLPLGYFGLGIAQAELGDDDAAAASLRQAIDQYPGWLAPSVDWVSLIGDDGRMTALLAASARRAERGDRASVFVAGILRLYGGDPTAGRAYLSSILPDEHADILLSRSESAGR